MRVLPGSETAGNGGFFACGGGEEAGDAPGEDEGVGEGVGVEDAGDAPSHGVAQPSEPDFFDGHATGIVGKEICHEIEEDTG